MQGEKAFNKETNARVATNPFRERVQKTAQEGRGLTI